MNCRIPSGPLEGHTLTVLRGPHREGRRTMFFGYLDGERVIKPFAPDYRTFLSRADLIRAAVKMLEDEA